MSSFASLLKRLRASSLFSFCLGVATSGGETVATPPGPGATEIRPVPGADAVFTLEEELECTGCTAPCSQHAAIPTAIAKRIVRDKALAGTVKVYNKHLVVLRASPAGRWKKKVELEEGTFVHALNTALAAVGAQPFIVKLTIGEDEAAATTTGVDEDVADILVFPDMTRYAGVRRADLAAFVSGPIQGGEGTRLSAVSFLPRALPSDRVVVLVCCHKLRDKRCGVIGQLLVARFREYVEAKGLSGRVDIVKSSHTGGHDYAGNVIVYPGGVWYGRVTPCHVDVIVDEHIVGGRVLTTLQRGRIAVVPTATGEAAATTTTRAPSRRALDW